MAADALTDADPTPGMTRRVAAHDQGMWTGTVDTEPGAVTGWHHHPGMVLVAVGVRMSFLAVNMIAMLVIIVLIIVLIIIFFIIFFIVIV